MTDGSNLILSLLVGVLAALVGLYLLAMGPTGWFLAVFLLIAAIATRTWIGDDEGEVDGVERRNCPACGARGDLDEDVCEYCGAPFGAA